VVGVHVYDGDTNAVGSVIVDDLYVTSSGAKP
jgi:hypothetical protein